MSKPRLLVLTEWFSPGYRAGGPIRSTTNLVSELAEQYEILVVTSDRDLGMDSPFPNIVCNEWSRYGNSANVMYLTPERQTVGAIGRIVAEANADCVYLNSMFSQRFTIPAFLAQWRGRVRSRVVLAPRGELLPGALRYKAAKKIVFLTLLRASGVISSLHFHATDDLERKTIISRLAVPSDCVTTVANFPEPPVGELRPLAKSINTISLLFLSRVAPKKNLLFLLERLREVPAAIHVRLTVAGPQEDSAYWERCSKLIQGLPSHVLVQAIGAVAHDQVRPLMASHHVFVLPTFGENYGHSIVEALGTGRPVLISDRTPWRGLASRRVGWDLGLEDPAAFTAAITAAARLDQKMFNEMCRSALEYARQIASASGLRDRYVDLFTPR